MLLSDDEKAKIYVAVDAMHDQFPLEFEGIWKRIRDEWYNIVEMDWNDEI